MSAEVHNCPPADTLSTNFGTTLWFDDAAKANNTLDHLILTGRAVCCFSLIGHIVDASSDEEDVTKNEILNSLISLWKSFTPIPDDQQGPNESQYT